MIEKDANVRILKSLRRIMRATDLHSRQLNSRFNITGPQLVCLSAIDLHKQISLKALAEAVSLSPSTVVGILDRLEDKGLVRRDRSTQDRRLIVVSLSDEGHRLLSKAPSPLQDRFASALEALPNEQQMMLAQSLERIVDLMEAGDVDAAPILVTGEISSS